MINTYKLDKRGWHMDFSNNNIVEVAKVNTAPAPSIFADDFKIGLAIAIFLQQNDLAQTTLQVYKRDLQLFFDWCTFTGRGVRFLTLADVVAWKNDLFASGKSSLTVAGYLTALRKFYEWLESNKAGVNITRGVKTPKRVNTFKKQHLRKGEAVALLNHFDVNQDNTSTGGTYKATRRNFAIVNLMLRTGLRCIEVVRANVGDLALKNGRRVLYVQGKGRESKDRFVMLTEKAYTPIKEYLTERGNPLAGEPLFTSESNRNGGRRLTTRTVSWICKDGLKSSDVGLDGREYTAHSLRHTCAVMILTHGGLLEDCQEILRHANPSTTQIYLESIKEERRLKRFAESRIDKIF